MDNVEVIFRDISSELFRLLVTIAANSAAPTRLFGTGNDICSFCLRIASYFIDEGYDLLKFDVVGNLASLCDRPYPPHE